MSSKYGWKFILDGTTDITDKVTNFSIECSLETYCRELSLDLADDVLYDTLDFSVIPDTPRIEVFTAITSTVGDYGDELDYISQGVFFIERPTFSVNTSETLTGLWGRQSTAILGEPFAQKITKIWNANTTVFQIFQEILELVGLTWDFTRCDLQDFMIYADTFEAYDIYPIEALQKLTELIVGAEGFVTSDRLGNIWFRRLSREPETADYSLVDNVIQTISDEPEWPEFGNRIKIIPGETTSQNTVTMSMESTCMTCTEDETSYIVVYGQIKDGEGVPLNDIQVDWSFSPANPASIWYMYPSVAKTSVQNAKTMLISKELAKADGFRKVSTKFQASSIVGIYAYSDRTHSKNFAPEDGYVIDGNDILLTDEAFTYCDQTVLISYYASGMVRNQIICEPEEYVDEDTLFGEVVVIAAVSGREATETLYVNNSCKCPPSLTVEVDPSSCAVGEEVTITAYVEADGVPISGTVRMQETSGFGTLQRTVMQTDKIKVTEKTEAVNNITGTTQCVLSSAIESVVSVYRLDSTGAETGSNLYSSFNGRTIDLTTAVDTGTDLSVTYYRAGSVVNYMTADENGTAVIIVSVDVDTEAGLSQTVQVTIGDTSADGSTIEGEYMVLGPDKVYASYGNSSSSYSLYTTGGPWRLVKKVDGQPVYETYSLNDIIIAVSGSGTYTIQNYGYVRFMNYDCKGKVFTITAYDSEGHSASKVINVV